MVVVGNSDYNLLIVIVVFITFCCGCFSVPVPYYNIRLYFVSLFPDVSH
jgi:hypothetical protein